LALPTCLIGGKQRRHQSQDRLNKPVAMAKEHRVRGQLAAEPHFVFIIGLAALVAIEAMVEAVAQIAREEGYTPAQIALAWLLDCAPYIVPIPGTRNIKRLKENALSVMVRLGDAQLERLYGILRERPVTGARYPASSMVAIEA